MLFLTDAARGEGSSEYVPSIFRNLDRDLLEHPGPVLDVPVDVAGHGVVEVSARAGDLVIWDGRLPRQGGRNRGRQPRVSLAVSMHPRGRTPIARNVSNAGSGNARRVGGVAGRGGSIRNLVNQPTPLRSVVGWSELIVGHSVCANAAAQCAPPAKSSRCSLRPVSANVRRTIRTRRESGSIGAWQGRRGNCSKRP